MKWIWDLIGQWRAEQQEAKRLIRMTAVAAAVSAGVATVGIIVSLVQSHISARQADISIAQAVIATKTLREMQDEQRPWVAVTGVKFYRSDKQGYGGFDFTVTNSGKVPPTGLWVGAKKVIVQSTPNAWEDAAEVVCGRGKAAATRDPVFTKFSVLPGVPLLLRDAGTGGAIDTQLKSVGEAEVPGLHIVGCVVYRIPDGRLRTTQFIAPVEATHHMVKVVQIYAIEPS